MPDGFVSCFMKTFAAFMPINKLNCGCRHSCYNAVIYEMDQVWRPKVPSFLDCVCMCMELIEGFAGTFSLFLMKGVLLRMSADSAAQFKRSIHFQTNVR